MGSEHQAPLSVLQVPAVEQELSTHAPGRADPLKSPAGGTLVPTELGELTLCEHEDAKAIKALCLLPWTCVITYSRVLGSQRRLGSITLIL